MKSADHYTKYKAEGGKKDENKTDSGVGEKKDAESSDSLTPSEKAE